MGVHVAGTQRGLAYRLAPLEGTRAPALIALKSRAPAAHVQFWPLQHLIWQIQAGLAYSDMSPESRALIDQLIPEYSSQLNENFVQTMQKACGGILGKISRGLCNDINVMMARYQQSQQTLQQYANNYQALAQHMVNVIPGTYPNAGPTSWSQLNPRVYARVTGGHVYNEDANLEIRVLSSTGVANPVANRRAGGILRNASYHPSKPVEPIQSPTNDTADVPIEAVMAYPNNAAGMQGLTIEPTGGGVRQQAQEVLTLAALSIITQKMQSGAENLMWIDCAVPSSVGDVAAYVLQPVTPPSVSEGIGLAAQFNDVYDAIVSALEDGAAAGLLAGGFEQVAFYELQQQGISCSKYNVVQAVMSAAKRYHASAAASPFTSAVIPGSLSLNGNTISGRVLTSSRATIAFQLELTQCSPAADCRARLSGSSSSPFNSQTISPGGIPLTPPTQRPPASGTQADQAMVSDVNTKLWRDPVLKTQNIEVSAQNGVVTLTGTVNTQLEKHAVERIASSERGVTQVVDQLTVSGTSPQ